MTTLATASGSYLGQNGSDGSGFVNPVLPRLLNQLSGDMMLLQMLDRYYTGNQPLSFLAPEVQRRVQGRLRSLVLNWARLVVNSLEERLDVEGFRLAQDQPADDELWRIWQANDLDEGSQMAHVDSLVHGRSFAIVWANEDDPRTPLITVESAEQMTVQFEPGTTRVVAAAKHWAQDDMVYATLYLPNMIERYVAPQVPSGGKVAAPADWTLREDPIQHDLGVVPVVPFLNRPRLMHPLGESELTDLLPLVDAVNTLATNMMTSAEYHAMPRRWATGIDLGDGEGSEVRSSELIRQRWSNSAADHVWTSDDAGVRFGQFAEASLDNYIRAIEMLAAQIAAIAALPPHYVGLMSQANPASADAIRSAESSLVKRAQRKQRVFGGGWERVMRLAMLVRDGSVPPSTRAMETIWRDPETPTVSQRVDAAVKLEGIGMPFRQSLEDLGYGPTQIARAIKMRTDDALSDVEAQLGYVDEIVTKYGISRAAALAAVGLEQAAQWEARVEARQPGPGVATDAQMATEVAIGGAVAQAAQPGALANDSAAAPNTSSP